MTLEFFDIEKAVIGAVLSEPNLMGEALSLPPDLFQVKGTRTLWEGILSLSNKGKSLDPVLLSEEIGAKEMVAIEGESLILNCFDSASVGSFPDYVEQLKSRKHKRDFKQVLQQASIQIEDDLATAKQTVQNGLIQLSGLGADSGFVSAGSILADLLGEVMMLRENPEERSNLFLHTGFSDYDKAYGGLPQGLTILAGRPAMGKTSYALSLALNVLRQGKDVLFFSLEMSKEQLMNRLLSSISGIDSLRITLGDLTDFEFESYVKASSQISDLPLEINERARTLPEIRGQIEQWRLVNQRNPGLVVIDYLSLIEVPGLKGESAMRVGVGKVCNQLSVYFTKDLKAPLLVLAQLNRGVEERTEKRPMLKDLRESGEIEQAAARVDFIYRDVYYNPDTPKQSCAEIITAKNRFGATGTTELFFEPQTTTFHNYGGVGDEPF